MATKTKKRISKDSEKLMALLIEKSQESFLLSIELFNKPTISLNVEGFVIFICNAWELLFKAYLISQWLNNYMFKRNKNRRKINKIVSTLNSNTKSHSNHLNYDTCKKMGLVVEKLEEDEKLYNLVMNIHNCYFLTIMSTVASKLIESKDGRFIISSPQK